LAAYLAPAAIKARASAQAEQRQRDWPNLCRYQAQNAERLKRGRPRVVIIGASIVQLWQVADPSLFGQDVVDRGISGQTTAQILARFQSDVIALRPRAVHILAGTNDIAGNTGPTTPTDFQNNIAAMVDIAQANKVAVVLAAIPPVAGMPRPSGGDPSARAIELNRWLAAFAHQRGIGFVDYYAVLVGENRAYRPGLSNDGVHPNADGYALMRPLFKAAVTTPHR
jgi:lysophospholipase L1-like esterase